MSNQPQTSPNIPEPKNWTEIFVPTGFPKHNFVDRDTYAAKVDEFLLQPGYDVLALSGLSRTGKTTLLTQRFRAHNLPSLWFSGGQIETIDQFMDRLREMLRLRDKQLKKIVSGEVEINPLGLLSRLFGLLRIGRATEVSENDDVELIDILRELNGKVVVIDDFHRIPEEVRSRIMAFVKYLIELPDKLKNEVIDFRFILVFIPNTDTIFHALFKDLKTRIQWLELPLWQEDELLKITRGRLISEGKVLLGLRRLARESYGLPSMMQLLCRNYCRRYLSKTPPNEIVSVRDDQLESVFVETGTDLWGPYGDSVYRELVALNGGGRSRPEAAEKFESKVDRRTGDLYQMIWYIVSLAGVPESQREGLLGLRLDNRLEISLETINQRLERLTNFPAGQIDHLSKCLTFLSDETRMSYPARIRREVETHADEDRANTHLNDPLFEYVDETLVIFDPAILIALAHAPKHKAKFSFPTNS